MHFFKTEKVKNYLRSYLKESVWKELGSILIIIFLVFAFRSSFYEPYVVPTGSMIPNLLVGDFLVADKWSYGLKVPFSDLFGDPIYITSQKDPERGDIVIFKYPHDTSMNYVKRLIGLPGDIVEVKDKEIYVNNIPIIPTNVTEKVRKKIMEDMDDKFKKLNFTFWEAQYGRHKFIYQTDNENFFFSDFSKIIVPQGQYFCMGDNRDYSGDSRQWGFVPKENIKGKAKFIWMSAIFPWNKDNAAKFRPWRIGLYLDK
ncbi:MAG: signal peptidase I [Oligoflexia bacterium]|nr:signal peptidase I [Oligoflexia bacterium]